MQLQLILSVLQDEELPNSRILSSACPRIGKTFQYRDLELKKNTILLEARMKILRECSVVEANRDILKLGKETSKLLDKHNHNNDLIRKLQKNSENVRKKIRKTHDKKTKHFLGRLINPSNAAPLQNPKRGRWRNINKEKKKEKRKKYLQNKNRRKKEWLKNKVNEISSTVVRNLSCVEIPDETFLYLAKGLNFVESKKASKPELLYDTQEFLRKMEWKAYFHENPKDDSFSDDIHQDLRIPSRKHPEGFNSNVFDEIKTKLKGFVANFQPENPGSNLTAAEERGKAWILKEIENEKLFITKADKGGATLILDYNVALDSVTKALAKQENFVEEPIPETKKMAEVQKIVKQKVLELHDAGIVTERDKKIITGLNENNNIMHAHCFKPVVPYVYPLFKIHKLSQEQIKSKTTPPIRLVHATREGPLYRLEKWVSPYLTEVSRKFCEEEFILDSPALISCIKDINNNENLKGLGQKIHLFTLDVVNLYPSIDPDLALKSLQEALNSSNMDESKCQAVQVFTDLIFRNSYVCFQERVFRGTKGIPTGNCVSRQIADITLHVLLFATVKPLMENLWQLIRIWKRYIDDVFGVWTGTERQFHLFVKTLNQLAQPYGIQFGDFQFGKEVNYLDMNIYLSENSTIDYRLYKKDTDARLFLQTNSFHPKHVFKSVVFSQMIRVIQRNSQDQTCVEDLTELKDDLTKCGHQENVIDQLEPLAVQRAIENDLFDHLKKPPEPKRQKLIYSVKYFKEIDDLKRLVHSMKEEIEHLCGDINITFALRKQPSVGNTVVRNRRLSECPPNENLENNPKSQKCGSRGCMTCPQLFDAKDTIFVNGAVVNLDFRLSCKDKNIVYVAQCQICSNLPGTLKEDTYFGQTVTSMHTRMNGHRNKFVIDDRLEYEKSALSMHCFLVHNNEFSMTYFKLGIVKKVRPVDLDREEDKFITRYRTKIWGLNRIVVVR